MDKIARVRSALAGIDLADDPPTLRRKSRDFFWYSPILSSRLARSQAELIATPRDIGEVARILSACAQAGVPVTARGGGTGNYGQATPLQGGVVLEMTRVAGIEWLRDGVVRVLPGTNIFVLDEWLRERGAELRLYPSTKRSATIGGLICGGAGGIGSVSWGMLWDAGNIVALDILTMEPEPRRLHLRGEACGVVSRCFGTTGIVVAVELPVQPALRWRDVLVGFDGLRRAALFGRDFTAAQGIDKKLCSVSEAALTGYFPPFRGLVGDGVDVALLMVAPNAMQATRDLAHAHGGTILGDEDAAANEAAPDRTPLYEFSYNHTTLQVLKRDRDVTYVQTGFPAGRIVECLEQSARRFGAELLTHLEFIRSGGVATCTGAQVIRYSTAERLLEIMTELEAIGIQVFDPHVVSIEAMGRHRADCTPQLRFKREVDPYGLLNPGKLESFEPAGRA